MDDIICYALARKFNNVTILRNSPVPKNNMAVVFNKEQTELHRQFNEFLRGLKESGELETICDNWIHRFETTPMPKLNLPTKGEPIRVGMEPCTEPTVFVRDGEIVGRIGAISATRPMKPGTPSACVFLRSISLTTARCWQLS